MIKCIPSLFYQIVLLVYCCHTRNPKLGNAFEQRSWQYMNPTRLMRSIHSTPCREWSLYDTNRYYNYRDDKRPDRFMDELVQALDLIPIMNMVTSFCTTYRGQQALFKLVGQDDTTISKKNIEWQSSTMFQQPTSSRKNQLYDLDTSTQRNFVEETKDDNQWRMERNICPIANSVEEVIDIYQLVIEATHCLDGTSNITFPPIYPVDCIRGPFDLLNRKSQSLSDDDDFLKFTSANDDQWTLEHVLQADQVIAKLIMLHVWAMNHTIKCDDEIRPTMTLTSIQSLIVGQNITTTTTTTIINGIDIIRLTKVWSMIHDSVEIVRVRTLTDAWGQLTYQFRLRTNKFPILRTLRDRYDQMHDTIQRSSSNNDKQELYDLEQELTIKENEIKIGLINAIHSIRHVIDRGLDILATVDVIFAKAAFGIHMGANITTMDNSILSNNSNIQIEQFIHPLLGRRNDASVVPIDLVLGDEYQTLIISGTNGGGKSVAMKSFGLISVLAKIGIPIVASSIKSMQYFDEVLVSVGDYQNIERGESTYISQLLRYSELIERIHINQEKSYLVLLDELGTGTEETPGGAIGQAIVEALMAIKSCFIVATTHSPLLKMWSFNSANIGCAAVLLEAADDTTVFNAWNCRPSYQLQYGCIGESYALGAASRCLPETIVSRASSILDRVGNNSNSEYLVALTKSMERQVKLATERALQMNEVLQDTVTIQAAMVSLANSYDRHLSRLERRIEMFYEVLRKEEDLNDEEVTVNVLGKTLAELHVVRTTVKRDEELLRDHGLRRIQDTDVLTTNQNVVVVDTSSPWNGKSGTIASKDKLPLQKQESLSQMDVVVIFPDTWNQFHYEASNVMDESLLFRIEPVVFKRYQLAIWDYKSDCNKNKPMSQDSYSLTSTADATRRLRGILSKLQASSNQPQLQKISNKSSAFTSSRERKSAKRNNKKK